MTHKNARRARCAGGLAAMGMVALAIAGAAPAAAQQAGAMKMPSDSGRAASGHAKSAAAAHDSTGAAQSARRTPRIPEPLGIGMTREGSGTSWVPDASPMYAHEVIAGSWQLMLHGNAFVTYDQQNTRRGDRQFGSTDWGMVMARHALAGGALTLRGMMSLENWTVTPRGYPLILQSGESYHGQALHDRQHPHDLFMEIAAMYDRRIAPGLGLELYAAPVGEPVLGPVAFPHRPSAADDPFAPLSHHWQDATHISFGVATVGLFTRHVKIEGSIFNGREPDEIRTNFDYHGRSLDSYAGRITVNPDAHWSVSASYGYLKTPEGLHPNVSVHRVTASLLNARSFRSQGTWSSALIYGANRESGEAQLSNSILAETDLDLDGTNTIFGRAEYVQKSPVDLAVPPTATLFDIESFALGYVREIAALKGGTIGLGVRGSLDLIPASLTPSYGTRTPTGFGVFFRVRPTAMHMSGGHAGMGKMQM